MLIAEKKKRTKTWLHHFIHYRLNNKWSAWSWMTDSVGCFLYSKPWREQRKDALSFFSKVMKIHRLKKMKQWRAMIGYLLKINGIYKNTCKCLGDLVLYLLYWRKKKQQSAAHRNDSVLRFLFARQVFEICAQHISVQANYINSILVFNWIGGTGFISARCTKYFIVLVELKTTLL